MEEWSQGGELCERLGMEVGGRAGREPAGEGAHLRRARRGALQDLCSPLLLLLQLRELVEVSLPEFSLREVGGHKCGEGGAEGGALLKQSFNLALVCRHLEGGAEVGELLQL